MASKTQATDRQYDERWTEIWQSGLSAGERFDASMVSPSLVNLIQTRKLHMEDHHIFIPGCGRGYDVVEFVRQGAASATGMELVPEAVSAAKKYIESSGLHPGQQARANVVTGDFFRTPNKPPYSLGYDYTFFCAMDPEMRNQWGDAWAHWLKPGGVLVTLMFPVEEEGRQGPPWPVPTELYHKYLEPHGFKCVYLEQVPPEQCHKSREGKTWMGIWQHQ